jgi:hypothetical protein
MAAGWRQVSVLLILSGLLAGTGGVDTFGQDPEGPIQRRPPPKPPAPPAAPPVTNPPPGHLPCNWTGSSGGHGITRNKHYLGDKGGLVTIHYELYTIPDDITVTYNDQVLAGTYGPRNGSGRLVFNWRPNGNDYSIVVTVTGPHAGTQWRYAMACPR